jgi:hypothetical protein
MIAVRDQFDVLRRQFVFADASDRFAQNAQAQGSTEK